jgi:hypothetical protein
MGVAAAGADSISASGDVGCLESEPILSFIANRSQLQLHSIFLSNRIDSSSGIAIASLLVARRPGFGGPTLSRMPAFAGMRKNLFVITERKSPHPRGQGLFRDA